MISDQYTVLHRASYNKIQTLMSFLCPVYFLFSENIAKLNKYSFNGYI